MHRRAAAATATAAAAASAAACCLADPSREDAYFAAARRVPLAAASAAWGQCARAQLPAVAREPVLGAYCTAFGADASEAALPLASYESLASFFCRELRSDARPIAEADAARGERALVVSPCDGTVLASGQVHGGDTSAAIGRIKGVNYSPHALLAVPKEALPDRPLHYAVLYLAPGDYHRVHSPAALRFERRRHVSGALLPVNPIVSARLPGLHAANERVVFEGSWEGGWMSMTAVGALGVGSIKLLADHERGCSSRASEAPGEPGHECKYSPARRSLAGEQVCAFELGSTVVLLFEAPSGWTFDGGALPPGTRVRVGQRLGTCGRTRSTARSALLRRSAAGFS